MVQAEEQAVLEVFQSLAQEQVILQAVQVLVREPAGPLVLVEELVIPLVQAHFQQL